MANLSDTAANAEATALAALTNSGLIRIYSGLQPANANTPVSGTNTLLVTLTFGNPAWGAPAGGVLTANPITPGTAIGNGTATFARIFESNGTTVVMDYTVGLASAVPTPELIISTTSIIAGAVVSTSSPLTHTVTEI